MRLLRPGFTLAPDNVRIDGGERVATVPVEWVRRADALPPGTDPALVDGIDDLARTLVVRTDGRRRLLALHAAPASPRSGSDQPPAGFDPQALADRVLVQGRMSVGLRLRARARRARRTIDVPPEIDYLAKDYPGFRRLMLDRLNLLTPGWTERSAADLGVALVELLAYAADNLSYRQDAIANEAYLATARKRVSVRRHARLVDYSLHEGCNARAWVHLEVDADVAAASGHACC